MLLLGCIDPSVSAWHAGEVDYVAEHAAGHSVAPTSHSEGSGRGRGRGRGRGARGRGRGREGRRGRGESAAAMKRAGLCKTNCVSSQLVVRVQRLWGGTLTFWNTALCAISLCTPCSSPAGQLDVVNTASYSKGNKL